MGKGIDAARALAEAAARKVEMDTFKTEELRAIRQGLSLAAARVRATDAATDAGKREFQRVYWEEL